MGGIREGHYSAQQVARYGMSPGEKLWVSAVLAGLWPYRTYVIGWAGYDVRPYPIAVLAAPVCLLIAAPLAMLLLPDTFKMARVRRRHLLRGAIYGISAPALATIVIVAVLGYNTIKQLWSFGLPPPWMFPLMAGAALTALIWYVLFWWHFTRRYLQLPRGWLVAISILIIAALLATTVAVKLAVLEAQRFH